MFVLFTHGLDMTSIKQEIKQQAKLDESTAWLSFFFVGLDELVEEYHVIIPRYNEFLQMAENEMTERLILIFLQKKPQTIHELYLFSYRSGGSLSLYRIEFYSITAHSC
jgi:hypothetical protein